MFRNDNTKTNARETVGIIRTYGHYSQKKTLVARKKSKVPPAEREGVRSSRAGRLQKCTCRQDAAMGQLPAATGIHDCSFNPVLFLYSCLSRILVFHILRKSSAANAETKSGPV